MGKLTGLDSLVGESILTATVWGTRYTEAIKGASCAEVMRTNNNLMAGTAPTEGVNVGLQVPLEKWYRDNTAQTTVIQKAQKTMQAGLANCLAVAETNSASSSASTSVKSDSAPSSLISSYSEFGHLYSRETQGRSWSEINRIDALVRGSGSALGASGAIQKLQHWYRHRATAAEKKDFDHNAVAHMKMGDPNSR